MFGLRIKEVWDVLNDVLRKAPVIIIVLLVWVLYNQIQYTGRIEIVEHDIKDLIALDEKRTKAECNVNYMRASVVLQSIDSVDELKKKPAGKSDLIMGLLNHCSREKLERNFPNKDIKAFTSKMIIPLM